MLDLKMKHASRLLQGNSYYKLQKKLGFVYNVIVYLLLITMAFVFLYPFLYMISTSVKSYNDLINVTVKWIPREWSWVNYKVAADALTFFRSGGYTLLLAVINTFGHVTVCAFVAYGFARFKFPLRNFFFAIAILTIIVPIQTIIVQLYTTYVKFGVMDSYVPLIVPTFFGYGLKGGLFIFLFNQCYIRMPKSLEEAAAIDGCGPIKTYFKIAFPTAGSMTIVCIMLSMVWHWNDYFEPSIYLIDDRQWLLPQLLPGLKELIQRLSNTNDEWMANLKFTYHNGVVMAGTVLSTLPILLVYIILQRRFMEGIERSGLVE